MAKRKRLGPAALVGGAPAPSGTAPIADLAGAAAATAALEDLASEMQAARESGRIILSLPLEAVDEAYLVRDRIAMDPGELEELVSSLQERGQQVPVEVVALEDGRYGLISGWRRITALRQIGTPEVLAVLRKPQDASVAYQAMVEENEIRAGLSFYEKGRIAARAVEQGAYADKRGALRGLYGNVAAPKRSKIGAFMGLYEHLDDVLRFPSAIPEHLGLALARALEQQKGFAKALRRTLERAGAVDAAAERKLLDDALKGPETQSEPPEAKEPAEGIVMRRQKGRITLSGTGVTDEFAEALEVWLANL